VKLQQSEGKIDRFLWVLILKEEISMQLVECIVIYDDYSQTDCIVNIVHDDVSGCGATFEQ